MKNEVQLIISVDRPSGGGFPETMSPLDGRQEGLLSCVNALPFSHSIDAADFGIGLTWTKKQSMSPINCRANKVDEDTDNDQTEMRNAALAG